ncbi:Cellular adhesion and filamentous growth protein [Asimina triloba]
MGMAAVLVAILVVCCGVGVKSDGSDHKYKATDPVPLYANKVGPFHNPRSDLSPFLSALLVFRSDLHDTMSYALILGFLDGFDVKAVVSGERWENGKKGKIWKMGENDAKGKGAHATEKKEALGEVLNGDRLVDAPYKLNFLENRESEVVCRKKLSKEEVAQFRNAVIKDYYFQMYYDDLPIWGFIGKVDKEGKSDPSEYKYYLYRHLQFDIQYNKDRVIEINVRTDPSALVDLTEDKEVEVDFMYTVKWRETDIPFEMRMEKYAHDEEAADDQEESGWKYIHGDVFRYPKYKSLLAASLGSGTQLFTLTIFIFLLALVGVFYPYNRGALFTALVVIYALTSGIAGYVATSFYCQLEGTNWVRNLLLTSFLFCGPLFLTFCFLNTVAIAYSATAALPFGTIVVIGLIWALVTLPLLILGGIAGKNSKAEFQAPCRTAKYPREIPPLPWYRQTLPQMAMAGFLPFSAIYIELYYIFASVWGHRIYTIYSILFIVFIILLIVTAFITVALTYFQLAAEDHKWWWRKGSFKPVNFKVKFGYASGYMIEGGWFIIAEQGL